MCLLLSRSFVVADYYIQKWSSIEYDFTQHYDKHRETNGVAKGASTEAEEIQMIANQNI